jgi:2-hydroxycyclohexanecarboxyl-CoA dehydrogenase
MPELAPRRALVTGGGRGIGVRLAARLLADGAAVTVLDRDGDALTETADALATETGTRPGTLVADVTDVAAVPELLARAAAEDGPFDTLVNNAGAWTLVPFVESEPDQWRRDIDVNLFGVLNVTRAVLPGMRDQGYGRIVSIVSDSGRVGELNVAAYAAAKAGVMGFTRALAKEVGRDGITANCVSLSTTLTPGAADTYTPAQLAKMARRYPVGRLGRPEDAEGAVAYFASPDAAWVTGQVLSVNGGYAML